MNEPWVEAARLLGAPPAQACQEMPFEVERKVLGTISQQAKECEEILSELAGEWDQDARTASLRACETIRRAEYRIKGMFAHLSALAWGGAPRR
jgi:hypothetical protein